MYDIALLYLPNQISAPYFGIIPPYLNGKFGVTYDSVGQSVFALGWGITSTGKLIHLFYSFHCLFKQQNLILKLCLKVEVHPPP